MSDLPTERQVQRSILRMAGACFPDVWITHIPNGAHFAGNDRQRAMQMGALKGDGLKVGTPDLLCLWSPGQGCFLEVKREKTGKLHPDQLAVHERLGSIGWSVATVRTPEEAHFTLSQLGAPCVGKLAA